MFVYFSIDLIKTCIFEWFPLTVQKNITDDEASNQNWSVNVRSMKKVIYYKTRMDTNAQAIIEHNKIIKEVCIEAVLLAGYF